MHEKSSPKGGQQKRERQEALDGPEVLLAFGGTGGSGAAVVEWYTRNKGPVIVVTHQPDTSTYDDLIGQLTLRNVDTSSISLEHASLENPSEVSSMLYRLRDVNIGDVLMAPAGGIPHPRAFLEQLNTMVEVDESDQSDKAEKISVLINELNENLERWLHDDRENVYALNVEGPIRLVTMLSEKATPKRRKRVAYINSTFGHIGIGPHFYGGKDPRADQDVAPRGVLLKHVFRQWMIDHGFELAQQGVDLGEIVAPVILDTAVGRIIMTRIVRFYPEDIRAMIKNTAVRRSDVGAAVGQFFSTAQDELNYAQKPFTLYVGRDEGKLVISRTMPENLRADVSRAPF